MTGLLPTHTLYFISQKKFLSGAIRKNLRVSILQGLVLNR